MAYIPINKSIPPCVPLEPHPPYPPPGFLLAAASMVELLKFPFSVTKKKKKFVEFPDSARNVEKKIGQKNGPKTLKNFAKKTHISLSNRPS